MISLPEHIEGKRSSAWERGSHDRGQSCNNEYYKEFKYETEGR